MKNTNIVFIFLSLLIWSVDTSAQRRAGAKLMETDTYELYEDRSGLCDKNLARVSMVFKVSENYIITNDDAYLRRIEKEVLPLIRQRCNSAMFINISNYIKGVKLNIYTLEEYSDQPSTRDDPINRFNIELNPQGGLSYRGNTTPKFTSLADLRKKRESQREPGLPPGAEPLTQSQGGFPIYSTSSGRDKNSWCIPNVEVFITASDKTRFEKEPNSLRFSLNNAWGQILFFSRSNCGSQVKRINVKMIAAGQEVRRGWYDGDLFHEEFSEDQSPNPAKEKLATMGLAYQPIIDNLFYGRFDRVQAEDSSKLIFARIYQSFLREYGEKHTAFLQSPVIKITKNVKSTSRFGGVTEKNTEFKIEQRFEQSLSENLDNWGTYEGGLLIGLVPMIKIDNDMLELVSRHQGNSLAIRQFLENLYRYANDQPSVQVKPAKLSAVQENKNSTAQGLPSTKPINQNYLLTGRWIGKIRNDLRPTDKDFTIIFKKEYDEFTGWLGLRPFLYDIKVVSNVVIAKCKIGVNPVGINLKLVGETLKGQGTFEENGKMATIYFDLRRVSTSIDDK